MFFREAAHQIAARLRGDFGEPPPKQYITTASMARGQLCEIVGGQYVVPVGKPRLDEAARLERDLEACHGDTFDDIINHLKSLGFST